MPSLIYVLRSPPESISHSLYDPKDSIVVLHIRNPAHPVSVLHAGQELNLKVGQTLNYEQFLNILLEGTKVITL
jgi:hypothetical protein